MDLSFCVEMNYILSFLHAASILHMLELFMLSAQCVCVCVCLSNSMVHKFSNWIFPLNGGVNDHIYKFEILFISC